MGPVNGTNGRAEIYKGFHLKYCAYVERRHGWNEPVVSHSSSFSQLSLSRYSNLSAEIMEINSEFCDSRSTTLVKHAGVTPIGLLVLCFCGYVKMDRMRNKKV